MHISIIVPEQGVIEAISPPYRLFKSANDFMLSKDSLLSLRHFIDLSDYAQERMANTVEEFQQTIEKITGITW